MESHIHINIGDLFRFVARGLPFSLLIATLAAGTALFFSYNTEPVYEARATLLAAEPNPSYRDSGIVTPPPVDTNIYRSAVLNGLVVEEAKRKLVAQNVPESLLDGLFGSMTVTTDAYPNSSLIHLDVRNQSPDTAAEAANALSEALSSWDSNRVRQSFTATIAALEEEIEELNAEIGRLESLAELSSSEQQRYDALLSQRARRITDLNAARAQSNSVVVFGLLEPFNRATPPASPLPPLIRLKTALAFVLGLVAGYAFLWLRALLDTRIGSSEELARVSGLPVMAEFPRPSARTRHLTLEAANFLRTNLQFAAAHTHPKIILVTCAQDNEEKSGVALNVAQSFTRNEQRTLLIDADLRQPSIAQMTGLSATQYPSLQVYLEDPHQNLLPAKVSVAETYLEVLPTFEAAPSPAELLSQGFRDLLEVCKKEYDVIIINASPLLPVADALTIAPLCTGTVLSASLQNSNHHQIRAAVTLLQRIGVPVLGAVATNVKTHRESSARYGYSMKPVQQ